MSAKATRFAAIEDERLGARITDTESDQVALFTSLKVAARVADRLNAGKDPVDGYIWTAA